VGEHGLADISFTVPRDELAITLEAVKEAIVVLGAGKVSHDESVSKVSAVGLGMAEQAGVAERMFSALACESVNIQMISTSEIKISALVERDAAMTALRAVHGEFDLETPPPTLSRPVFAAGSHPAADAADVVSRLRDVDMENLVIEGISLDDSQARVTISGVPDQPGVAARVFREVAEAGVFVDMIVQSHDSHADHASLTFTIPREQVAAATEVAQRMAEQLACKTVSSCPNIAKLSVSGVGLRSHTGVAIRMFRALADAGVNVEMINTSEVRVNVVVGGADGPMALESLRAAFADALE
jgi:aspartate kinase